MAIFNFDLPNAKITLLYQKNADVKNRCIFPTKNVEDRKKTHMYNIHNVYYVIYNVTYISNEYVHSFAMLRFQNRLFTLMKNYYLQ